MKVHVDMCLLCPSAQSVLMTLESSKTSALLAALEFNPDVAQKTLIVANSAEDVEDVFKVSLTSWSEVLPSPDQRSQI